MDTAAKQAFIRACASGASGGVLWSRHAIAKLVTENLMREQVETALASIEIIEDYPSAHRPLPDCLVLAFIQPVEPIHAVVAIDDSNARIFIITVYRPDPRRWTHDFRRRVVS